MAHTPGPWSLREDPLSADVYVEAEHGTTQIVRFGPRANWDSVDLANANLIIAVPNLLAACKADATFWRHYTNCPLCSGTTFCVEAAGLALEAKIARQAAIAKAEPEQAPDV